MLFDGLRTYGSGKFYRLLRQSGHGALALGTPAI